MPRGHDRALYILPFLPFDHRGSFQARLFGSTLPVGDGPTAEIAAIAKRYRKFVDVFEKADIRSSSAPSDRARSEHRQEG
jgi:hypothetical protein